MPLTFATFMGRGNTSNISTYVSPVWSPNKNVLILAWIVSSKASAPNALASITGNGLVWTQVTTQNAGSLNLISLWRAMSQGTTPASGGASMWFPSAQTGCAYGFLQVAGVPLSNDGSSAIVQFAKNNFGTGVTTSTTTLSALAKPSNAIVCGLGIGYNANPTKETAYTAAATHPGYNTPASRLGVSWLDAANEVTPSWSWTGACAPGAIAIELVAYGTNRNATTFVSAPSFMGADDSFDRANAALTSPWTNAGFASEGLKVVSNQCQKVSPTTTTDSAMHYTGEQCAGSTSEQYSGFQWVAGSDLGVIVRSTATQCYQANFTANVCAIHQWTSGGGWAFNVVTAIPCVLTSGDDVSFRVTGTTGAATFALFLNGSNVGTRVYAATPLVNGYPGISMYQGDTPIVDNWSGGPLEKNGLNWWSQLVTVGGAVVRTISRVSSIANRAIKSQWLNRRVPLVRPVTYVAKRLQNAIKTISLARVRSIALGRAVIYGRTIAEILNRKFVTSRVGWFRKSIPVTRNLSSSVKRIGEYIRKLAPSRDIRQLASRSKLSIRTIAIARSLVDNAKRIGNFIRRISALRDRAISVTRRGWLVRRNSLIRPVVLAVKRIANYKKTVSVARALLDRAGRVAVFARTMAIARSLRSLVGRSISLYVRRLSIQLPRLFSVKRIGQYIRRITISVSRLVAVGRSVSGQLTLRSVATIRLISLSVKRIATYKKSIAISRALVYSVIRLTTRIRRASLVGPVKSAVGRLRNLVRRSTNVRALLFVVKRLGWFKRPVPLTRPVSATVRRISQIGRRVSTVTRATLNLVRAIAGALTTRTVRTATRATYSVIRLTWRIRRAVTAVARNSSVRYSRWIKRYIATNMMSILSVKRVAEYIRRASLGMRNNFVILYMITSVLRIWNAVSSSYRVIVASFSSQKKEAISSDSKKRSEVGASSVKLTEFTTSSRQKERVS
jgi:hypothetical protein